MLPELLALIVSLCVGSSETGTCYKKVKACYEQKNSAPSECAKTSVDDKGNTHCVEGVPRKGAHEMISDCKADLN